MTNWFDIIGPSKITDQIWISGYAVAKDLWESNPAGITHVLNVSGFDYLEAESVQYMYVPINDGEPIPPNQFAACMAFMQIAIESKGKILVHCCAGISRSPTIVASFLHYSHAMEFNKAINYIMTLRPVVNPAVAVLNSARKQLGAWPYDGSMKREESEQEKLIADAVFELIKAEAEKYHPLPECPIRVLLLSQPMSIEAANVPRHTIKCACPPKG
jgi:hypothetical protein